MATVLFVGGVSPNLTQEELAAAFAQHTTLLASSVVRQPSTGQCIGQAYVTVPAEDVAKAVNVMEVGGNSVCVFPVDVEAWVSPVAPGAPGGAQGAAAGMASAPRIAPGGPINGDGGVPSTPHPNLQGVLDQLRAHLATSNRLAFNGKPYYMLLHEVCQKRQLQLQVAEGPEGAAFSCNINVAGAGGVVVCSGRATGASKKDAKHNAAAACLDRMLASGQVLSTELVAAMTGPAPNVGSAGGPGGDGGGGAMSNPAAATAMIQTQNIMRLGIYPKCEEVMGLVHGTDQGRVKTILMVLNEYAVRARLAVQHEELPTPSANALAGPFRFLTRLTDISGQPVVQATGVELRSKQEAKQAAAAAVIEALINNNMATVEGIARGR